MERLQLFPAHHGHFWHRQLVDEEVQLALIVQQTFRKLPVGDQNAGFRLG